MRAVRHERFDALLRAYVSEDGRVDYERWHASKKDVGRLDAYLAELTNASPDVRPDLFTTEKSRLSYWINLYNALVIREILARWPLESVTDVKPSLIAQFIRGKGFFDEVRFRVGGEEMSLLDIENKIIRGRFKDPRIHFALNCGSSSCPVLSNDAFDPEALDRQLDLAATSFVNDGKNVRVDPERRKVVLSAIFDWYEEDFLALYRQVRPAVAQPNIVDYLLLYAEGDLEKQLQNARTMRFSPEFLEYDWSVNKGEAGGQRPPVRRPPAAPASATSAARPGSVSVGKPLPAFSFPRRAGGAFTPEQAKGKVLVLDFWATWCVPCRASFPKIEALYQKHKAAGLEVIAVSQDDDDGGIDAFMKQTGATFPVAMDPEGLGLGVFGVTELPAEIVVDRKGIVRAVHVGDEPGAAEQIEAEVEALLREPP